MQKHGFLLAVLLLLVGCGQGLPRPGDTVAPRIVQPVNWTAGEETELFVELAATNESGRIRRLTFAASPNENPVASFVFYDTHGEVIGREEVELSTRC